MKSATSRAAQCRPRRQALAALAVGLGLMACRPPAPGPAARLDPPPAASEYRVKEATLADGMVSVVVNIPIGVHGPTPTVIALIGDPRQFLGAGFVAVTYKINWPRNKPPTPSPGDVPAGKWVLASPSAALLGEGYLRSIAATATDYVPLIIDWLATLPEVDIAHIGMTGGSTNGFITLQALAVEPRLRAAVAIAACGDYHAFLRDSSMGMAGGALALDPAYGAWVDAQEVIRAPQRLVHAALLLIARTGDELIPIACADETARVLAEAYAAAGASERFRYLRLDASGHGVGADERRAAFEWLHRWLQ